MQRPTYLGAALQNVSLSWGRAYDGTQYVNVFAVLNSRPLDHAIWVDHTVYFYADRS
jgi:hypothetical protein